MKIRSDSARSDPASAATSQATGAPRHEAMLAALEATALSLAGAADWRAAIDEVLARLGAASDVSRVTLFEIHPGPAGLATESCRFDWAEPGLARLAGDPHHANIPITDPASGALDDWARRRAAGEIVAALREETTGETRRFFEEHGTLSFLSVPLHVDGQWWGFLGFDDCRTARRWSALETGLLRTAATMIAAAIQRETYERRLRQSEERHALAARGANDGLFDFDLVAGTGYFSERVGEILGMVPSASGGVAALEAFLAAGERSRLRGYLEGILAARAPQFEIEARLAAVPDAPARWIVLRGLVLYGEAGGPVRIVGSLRDISARKRAEAALAEARQQLAVAIEAIQDGFVLFDRDDRLVLFNRHYLERFSANPEAVRAGMTIGELLSVEADIRFPGDTQRAERDAWVAQKVTEHKALMRDFVHQRHNGRWALLNEYRTADGGIVGVLTDVTDLKNRELELERNRRLLKAVVDAVPAMINIKDRESRYLLMNRFQAELYGTTGEGAIGRTAGEIMGADYGEQARAFDQRVLQSGKQSAVMEHDFVDVRGETHDWYTIKLPLAGDGELADGIITVALDVTQLIRLERARVNLARYVPPSMATILAESDEPMGPPRQQDVAVLFADIVGFTQLTADLPADKLFELLRGFQSRLADIVFAHGGTLDKFTGDGAMATFGTPHNGPNDAGDALACAVAIAEATDALNLARTRAGEPPIGIAIGLHYGPALLGNVGDERRLEFAVIGDTVNVAARLEELARELAARVVASETLCATAEREIAAGGRDRRALLRRLEPRPAQALRGRRSPVGIRILPAR